MNLFQELTELNVHHFHMSHHMPAVVVFFFLKSLSQWSLPLLYSDTSLITASSILSEQDIHFTVIFEECLIALDNSIVSSGSAHLLHLIFCKSFYHTDACTSRNFLVLQSTGG